MVLWMPRAGWMPPLKRSNDDLDVRDARGIGHHGAPRLRSTTNHVHRGRDQTAETLTQATTPTSLSLKEVA
jgi:hypothetical protein